MKKLITLLLAVFVLGSSMVFAQDYDDESEVEEIDTLQMMAYFELEGGYATSSFEFNGFDTNLVVGIMPLPQIKGFDHFAIELNVNVNYLNGSGTAGNGGRAVSGELLTVSPFLGAFYMFPITKKLSLDGGLWFGVNHWAKNCNTIGMKYVGDASWCFGMFVKGGGSYNISKNLALSLYYQILMNTNSSDINLTSENIMLGLRYKLWFDIM